MGAWGFEIIGLSMKPCWLDQASNYPLPNQRTVALIGFVTLSNQGKVRIGYGSDMILKNDLIYLYGRCGRMDMACDVFDKMPETNVVSWTAMMCGHLQQACGFLKIPKNGMQIHGICVRTGFEWFPVVANSAMDKYSRCGRISEAEQMFNLMPIRSLISWNAMIAGYALVGMACSGLEAIEEGTQILAYFITRGFPFYVQAIVSSALVDLYVKSKYLIEAQKVFHQLEQKNVISWCSLILGKQMHCYTAKFPSGMEKSMANSIINMYLKGYGKHGLGREAIRLFNKMHVEDVEPDGVTYLALLSACSHSGLVEESGCLKEAKELIHSMPLKPNIGICQTLLSACRVHGEFEMGRERERESKRIDEVEGFKERWRMQLVGIDKEVHFFYNGDERHPLTVEIHKVLKEMERRIKEEMGYAYEVRFALHNVEEESKAKSLRSHSEKLAIRFALVHGGVEEGGRTIRVFENLRVCGDCHDFIKGLSNGFEEGVCGKRCQ
ncbi:hypothetical protein RHSIM_Rhsim07G0155200 [Rhododendron simsii]|uniref:DYW domain-containing protein n=1 Tax=Rhododendron simsii TaxID=118357 RepID=A0A834GK60_RHOSS|nr:hypothetical protein RHSIM_Rhsim07G0155200 [Rhododendron simsii]